MEPAQFYGITERHAAEFAASATLAEFAASLDASKPGDGRVLQHIVATYPDGYWTSYYETIKAHGCFVSHALLMPHARKVTDLFESVMLAQSVNGCYRHEVPYVRDGYAFVSAMRAKGFAYFGYLGATYGYSKDWLKRGERLPAILNSGSGNWLTAAKPNAAFIKAYGYAAGSGDYNLATIEAVQWSDGRILILARDNLGFSSRWIAILDAGESAMSMLSEHELGEIAHEESARLAGYGTQWRITGTDRAKGAIGISESFSVTVWAQDRDDAWQAAWTYRDAKGRECILADSVESLA